MGGLADVTPEAAFEQYRGNIEDFDQAAPMMLCENEDGTLTVYQLMGVPVRDALRAMASRGERYRAILLSTEARMWAYTNGEAETEGPVDAAVFNYADHTGRTWLATRQFIRISKGKVRYLGDLKLAPPGGEGAIPEQLSRLCGREAS